MNIQRELRVLSACSFVIATIMGGAALYWLRPVLLPFVLAIFFVSGITPVLTMVEERLKAPRMIAIAVTLVLGFVLLAVVWGVIWVSVTDLANNRGAYEDRFSDLVEKSTAWMSRWTPSVISGAETDDGQAPATPATNSAPEDQLASFLSDQVRLIMVRLSGGLMDVLSSGTIVLIFVFFLMLGGAQTPSPSGLWREIDSQIRQYIVAKTMISLVTGAVFGLVLWFFGIPLAIVFGLLAFLLNFIPNIGPIVASLLPVPLIVLDPQLSTGGIVLVIALSATVQFVSGNVVEPKLMGNSFDLDPIAILLALMFWGMIWGIVGMFLATPILAALRILLDKFDRTRPVAHVLAGRMDLVHIVSESVPQENFDDGRA